MSVYSNIAAAELVYNDVFNVFDAMFMYTNIYIMYNTQIQDENPYLAPRVFSMNATNSYR